MDPHTVLFVEKDATPEEITDSTLKLIAFWSKYRRAGEELRNKNLDTIVKAYNMLMPMIPPRAMNGFVTLHEVNDTYLNSLEPTDRIFYESVIDYYALPLPG